MVLLDLQAMEMATELNGCGDDHGHGHGHGNGHSSGSALSLLLCGLFFIDRWSGAAGVAPDHLMISRTHERPTPYEVEHSLDHHDIAEVA
jgi:hypothetical protein